MSSSQPSSPQQQMPGSGEVPHERAMAAEPFLMIRAGRCICAIPLASVVETMRPLPTQAVGGVPPYVEGLSIIRGQTVPVLRLGSLLSDGELPGAERFVIIKVDQRRVALAVEAVLGVSGLDAAVTGAAPPLLRDVHPQLIAGLGNLDRELVLVLQSSRIVGPEVWEALETHRQGPQ